MLLFLNDVPVGGELHFKRLGMTFSPREGDAVVWSNVDCDEVVDGDMVH